MLGSITAAERVKLHHTRRGVPDVLDTFTRARRTHGKAIDFGTTSFRWVGGELQGIVAINRTC
jgi:hypothetical protein